MMMKHNYFKNKHILIVFCIALTARGFLFFLNRSYEPENVEKIIRKDAKGYHEIATNLVNGRGYSPDNAFLSMLRTPGYPLFITLFYRIFGIRPWIVIIAQIIMDSFSGIILMKVVHLLFKMKVALTAGILWSMDPFAIIYSNQLFSDCLFVFCVVVFIYLLIKFLKNGHKHNFFLCGFIGGLMALIKPVSLYLLILFMVFFFIRRMVRIQSIAICLIIFILTIIPWLVRNKIVHKHFFLSVSSNYNSLILYAVPVLSVMEGKEETEMKQIEIESMVQTYPDLYVWDPYTFFQRYRQRAMEIIRSHPLLFARVYVIGLFDMFFSVEKSYFNCIFNIHRPRQFDAVNLFFKHGIKESASAILNHYDKWTLIYAILMFMFLLFEYTFAVIGFILMWIKKSWIQVSILLITLLYFVFIHGAAGNGRFKLAIIPLYLVFVAFGLKH